MRPAPKPSNMVTALASILLACYLLISPSSTADSLLGPWAHAAGLRPAARELSTAAEGCCAIYKDVNNYDCFRTNADDCKKTAEQLAAKSWHFYEGKDCKDVSECK